MMDRELDELMAAGGPREAERLAAAIAALRSLPAEEIPRPIRFVSDKVFVPAWWQRLPVWGFASAAMLAGAIVAHGLLSRPADGASLTASVPAVSAPAPVDRDTLEREIETRLAAHYDRKLNSALRAARAEYDEKLEFERRAILVSVEENFSLLRKQMNRMYVASALLDGGAEAGSR
jgi:hypothetical protein